jgi:hypothetical protein
MQVNNPDVRPQAMFSRSKVGQDGNCQAGDNETDPFRDWGIDKLPQVFLFVSHAETNKITLTVQEFSLALPCSPLRLAVARRKKWCLFPLQN